MINFDILVMVLLALAVRLLVPKLMDARSAGIRFGIGLLLFGLYTVAQILVFRYLCRFDGRGLAQLTGNEVWIRILCGMLVTTVATVFAACLYFFSREKRKLSQQEKMKLKDL